MKHILGTTDWTKEDLATFLNKAEFMRESAESGRPRAFPLGAKTTLLFAEPSTRTCDSYDEAAQLFGCRLKTISGADGTSLLKGESLSASARMEAGYNADILVMRTKIEGGARWVAEMLEAYGFSTAIHNGGDGSNEHPSQALIDLFTIRQHHWQFSGLKIGIVGDLKNSRTVHSLVHTLRLLGDIEIVLVSAPEVRLQPWYTYGLTVAEHDRLEALEGCNFVYVTRVQKERFASELDYQRVRGRYVINQQTLAMLPDSCRIMHPQPIADGEIAPEIWRHPSVIMDEQARHGVSVRMALLQYSFEQRKLRGFSEPEPPATETVSDVPAGEALARKHDDQKHIAPIESGTVIDHIPHGMVRKVREIIDRELSSVGGMILTGEGLDSPSQGEGVKKDRLSLAGTYLDDNLLASLSLVVPTAVFNVIFNGRLIKRKVRHVSAIRDIGRCPNPNCVTILDVEAARYPKFRVVTQDRTYLACHYCDQHFSTKEVFA